MESMPLNKTPTPAPPSASAATTTANAKLRHAALLAGILAVIGALAGLVPRWHQREALRAETRKLSVPSVTVTCPVPGKAAAPLALPAEIKPYVEAPIYARANGYLQRWLVDIGAKVEAGQLLAVIDTPELNQELERSRAELAQAEAALALAEITATRWAELLKTASVSEQEAAEKQSDFRLKSATVAASKASVRRLEEMTSFARVTAPFAGTITARRTDVGELIAAGSAKELFRLAQTHTLRVFVRVPQSMARPIQPGQKAELFLAELPGRVFPAEIARTAGAMAADSRTLLVELAVDNAKDEILAGSFAQVRFLETKLDTTLTLPSNTLLFRAEGLQVGVVGPNGKVELRQVTIGRDFGPEVEVLAGVVPTDQVIVNPFDSLVSGTIVRIANAGLDQAHK